MKRFILGLVCLLSATAMQAVETDWLTRLQRAVQALGAYEVQFGVTTDGYTAKGSCRVSGEQYLLSMPQARVYSDGKARYEVNDRTREVVIDAVDTASRNLLDNPVHAFDFVGEQYAVERLSEDAERITLRLSPRDRTATATIELTLDKRTALPVAVVYGAEDLQIAIAIASFGRSDGAFPAFRQENFAGYEWIDFR